MEILVKTSKETLIINASGDSDKALREIQEQLDSDSPFVRLSNAFFQKSDIVSVVVKKQ